MSLSMRFCNACSKTSFTLTRKWLTGSLALEGGKSRTVNCVPLALNLLYRRVILSSISNLRNIVIVWKLWTFCAVTHRNTIFAIKFLIYNNYPHYSSLLLPGRTYDSQLKSQRWLLFRLITPCHQERSYYIYLHVAQSQLCYWYLFTSLCYFLLFIYLNMTSLTLIRFSVAIVMGCEWLLNKIVINEIYFHMSNYYFCICF